MLSSPALPQAPAAPASPTPWQRWRRWLVPVFGAVVLALLLSHAHKIDWRGAWEALQRYPFALLAGVLGLATASHVLYGCFDLIGRRHTRHGLPWWQSWSIGVTSYAFNLNLGSLVGGVGMRARLYAKAGLDEATISQVVALSLATNWLGYGVLAGGLFAAGAVTLPADAPIGAMALRALGVLMLALAAGYVAACAFNKGREWSIRGRRVHLPSVPLALLQLAMAAANWALMGGAMSLLLGHEVPYATALAVLMAASVVGVVIPIPSGLGVLEAVYLALLSGTVPHGRVMGAVLAYRALYYLLPLGGGLLLYAGLARYAKAHPAAEAAQAPA
ncbi:lysylphosphatidylglycerol synthase domain-containing protein [Pseudorhodoferax sp. Leaf267]|uniref:lysylphosphatidylglycerol synthase domain-containing protein n=1 Tax=Pseudorhodoferax sp. Leaf267 TaxID=1736316 RepID=UPI0006FEEA37|nr:lysylphosphatidylglycerol synthase domain-containing protein [Pseudorhodoferax sp. Leaf267]KQP11830.1 hypothetical protein ASF43_23025 [Pseudorhodoferax sp. Leaf267]